MAGGKETPRQKMIGMMYLVLTALLALNVSKSILDAFVAIEENIQKGNLTELFRGDEKKAELAETASDNSNPQRAAKALMLSDVVKDIDKMTAIRIKLIDDIKLEILKECGEDIKKKGEGAIIFEAYDAKKNAIKPIRMHLEYVDAKDKYDEPMRVLLGPETDIKKPAGQGIKLWKSINSFRKEVTERIASSQVVTGDDDKPKFDSEYSFKAPEINKFKDQSDLSKLIKKAVESSNVHPDDVDGIVEIYRGLTKEEYSEVHHVEDVHWMGKTFDHSPSVAAIASLSSLQKDILSARAQALSLIRSRVGGGEFSFNKIMALAYGPEVVNRNEEFTVEVLMAAYDSDKQPVVTYSGASVENVHDGKGFVKLTAGGSNMDLSGTVSIMNKSGIKKELPWTKSIIVIEPTGSIELTDLNVLYRGYPNKVEASGSGYQKISLSGSNVSISNSGKGYIVKPGKGKSATLSVTGKNADGASKVLKKGKYRVSNLPDPTLYWGAAKSGKKGSKSSRLLQAKYSPEIPLKANFTLVSWTCFAPGLKGKPPTGSGGNIGGAGPLINALKPGSGISFTCKVRGPDGITRQIGGGWSL